MWKLAAAIATVLSAIGMGAAYNIQFGAADTVPPFGLIIDEETSQPDLIKAKIELITAGGLYSEREIIIVASEKTHPDNLNAVQNLPNVRLSRSTAKNKIQLESEMKASLIDDKYFIHATQK